MKNIKSFSAFTLIELMVIIAIIGILAGVGTQMNFNKLGDANRITIFSNSIISQFETIRNDSLLGKGIDSDIGVPDSWKLTYTNVGSGAVNISYSSGATWTNDPSSSITPDTFYSIGSINCLSANNTVLNTDVTSAEIEIKGNDFSVGGDCAAGTRKINFTTNFRGFSDTIEINTLNGLIEIK